jgi:hypothetical protein
MSRACRTVAAVLAALPLVAVADDRLPMVYQAPAAPKPPPGAAIAPVAAAPQTTAGCSIALRKVEDVRRNKESVGAWMFVLEQVPTHAPVAGQSVLSGDGLKWLRSALQSLPGLGVAVQDGGAARETDVQLRLAHVWVPGFNMTAHVVLEARLPVAQGPAFKRYHGFGTKLNWAGTNAEFMETLNLAMHDALKAMAQDLHALCAGREPSGLYAEGGAPQTARFNPVPVVPPSPPQAPAAPAVPVQASRPAASGPGFEYRMTDRVSGKSHAVVLRGEAGDRFRLGELDLVAPPSGWPTAAAQSMKYSVNVQGTHRQYNLRFEPEPEEPLKLAAGTVRAVPIKIEGWLGVGVQIPTQARYAGKAWYAPDLKRVVRFEARSRISGSFRIDEETELLRVVD